jgi:hypothetical protein
MLFFILYCDGGGEERSLKNASLQETEKRCGPDKLKTLYYHRNGKLNGFNTADVAVRNWILASLIPPIPLSYFFIF